MDQKANSGDYLNTSNGTFISSAEKSIQDAIAQANEKQPIRFDVYLRHIRYLKNRINDLILQNGKLKAELEMQRMIALEAAKKATDPINSTLDPIFIQKKKSPYARILPKLW